jgi:hypothetical protein
MVGSDKHGSATAFWIPAFTGMTGMASLTLEKEKESPG